MAWYDNIVNTTKGNAQKLGNILAHPVDAVTNQLKQGALYKNRDALAALLRGDTAPIMAKLNEKSPANPMDAVNFGLGIAPLGMMIGKGSKVWNPNNEQLFSQLESKNVSPEQSWMQSTTLRGPEGALRQEISDKGSFLKGMGNFEDIVMKRYNALNNPKNPITRMTVGDVMYHPKLFEAYPHLSDVEIRFMPEGINTKARADLNNNVIEIHPKSSGEDAHSSMLHELQHFVQEHEGFARGGSKDEFMKQLLSEKDKIHGQISELNKQMSLLTKNGEMNPEQRNAYDLLMNARQELVPEALKYNDTINLMENANNQYRRLGGEAEARLAQTRRNLTPTQLQQNYPYLQNQYGLDVPFNELTVKK